MRFIKFMNLRLLFLMALGIGFSHLKAQVFVSPQHASSGVTLAIEINDAKDLEFLQKHLKRFYGVQHVRVNGNVNISKMAAVLELLDDLQDVQLLKFSGQLSDEDLLKLEWVDNVTLFLQNGKEDQILMNNNLGNLNGLTLIFEVAPTDFYFMGSMAKLKSLTMVAPFVAKEAKIAVQEAAKLKQLKNFGISLDKIGDLPIEITRMNNLKSLTIIDNLSWLTDKHIDNLPILHKNIEYSKNNQIAFLDFFYRSNDAELYAWDIAHLNTIFLNTRFAPIVYENGDSAEISSFADFVKLRNPKLPVFDSYSKDKPVLENLNDAVFTMSASNEEDRIYYLGKDAAVLVPKRCMVGNTDSVFRGEYILRCKWLNSPGKLFAQGQSLDYDSAGRKYQLAPEAVLDISASAGNEKLKLRDGYFIKIVFRSKKDTSTRFYAWNTAKNKWNNFYDYDYNFDDSKIVPIDFYNFYGAKKTATETYGVDRSDMTWRFQTQGYFYLLEPNVSRLNLENYSGYFVAPVIDHVPPVNAYMLKRGKNLIGLKKEFVDKKTEEGIVKFQVFDKTCVLFPELKPFENYVFEIKSAMGPRDFSTQFIRGAVYNDIRIEQAGSDFYMDLRTDEGYWRLNIQTPAEKYSMNPGKAKTTQMDFLHRYAKYSQALIQKETAFKKWANNYHTNAVSSSRTSLLTQTAPLKGFTNQEMRIRSLGLFSWATPVQQPDTFNLILKFTDEGGIPLNVKRAYVAHTGPFSYQTFGAADNYNCLVNPSKLLYIACVDVKNRVYILTAAGFKSLAVKNNSLIYLPTNPMPPGVKNIQQLEKILGINLRR